MRRGRGEEKLHATQAWGPDFRTTAPWEKRLGTEVQTCSPCAMKMKAGRSQSLAGQSLTKLLSSQFRGRIGLSSYCYRKDT